jgi:hypothetical protein
LATEIELSDEEDPKEIEQLFNENFVSIMSAQKKNMRRMQSGVEKIESRLVSTSNKSDVKILVDSNDKMSSKESTIKRMPTSRMTKVTLT